MSRKIQLRNFPDDLHRKLEARAAMAGMTLSDYLVAEVAKSASWPTPEELRARLAARSEVKPQMAPAEAVRAERESH